jgi:UDP-N-acetylmuramoylalanine--D-glutamate ligase
MDLKGRVAVVVGLGTSGVLATRVLLSKGARTIGTDSGARDRIFRPEHRALEDAGAVLHFGAHDASIFLQADLVVVSPGVPAFDALDAFENARGEVIGELELASRFVDAPIVLIGGTNGKSTTTALVGAMFTKAGRRTFVGGNFGVPLSDAVGKDYDVLVVEISSFQAERVPTLHARVHALLNVTEDHLDRYPSFEAYARAKGNPFERMTPDDFAVIPVEDAVTAREAARGTARVVTFSSQALGAREGSAGPRADVDVVGDAIVDARSGARYPLASLRIRGGHNVSNACAAVAVASSLGASSSAIAAALESFEGLSHRAMVVGAIDGVPYYDDSKGTNVGATVAALRGLFEPRAVLIAGGRDKLGSYEPLVEALRDKGRALVVIGEAAARIAAAASGVLPIEHAASMKDAVRKARTLARPGDAVLLSPACSSFDMFRDYKDRGTAFRDAVCELKEGQEP